MKKTFLIATLSLMFGVANAILPIPSSGTSPLKASSIKIPLGDNGKEISLEELAHIKSSNYEALTGKKMNIFQKTGFSIAQKKLRKAIAEDGTVKGKKYEKLAAAIDGETGFHLGGFALGFLVGLIGVIIAYLIKDDKKSNRVKWAWIGFGIFLVLYLILLLAIFL